MHTVKTWHFQLMPTPVSPLTILISAHPRNSHLYLYWSDGAFLCGGDAFLHGTHVSGQSWLIAYSRWDTTKQSWHLRTSLSESTGEKKKKIDGQWFISA